MIESKEDEIEGLKEELRAEQERCEKLSNSNDLLSKQIESLRSQLTKYIEENNESHENEYESAHLQQLLQEKQSELNEISNNYTECSTKLSELTDELEQSKLLLNGEINSHKQLEIQYEDLNNKYLQIENQRNELLTNSNENNNNEIIIKQLNEYEKQCTEKDNIISKYKLAEIELNQQLNDEISRGDGMQDLIEKKSLENMKLKDEIELLKSEMNNLKQNETLMSDAMDFRERSSAKLKTIDNGYTNNGNIINVFEPFNLPLEYFLKHLNDYKNDENNLELIWNGVDTDNNDQIMVSCDHLNAIFKGFIGLIKRTYIDEYGMMDKVNVSILNENEILSKLRTDYQRGVLNREYIQNKQMITKQMFLMGNFIDCIIDIEYKNNDDDEKIDVFDMLKYITTAPTIIGIDDSVFDCNEKATKINDIIENKIDQNESDKERLWKIVDVLMKCNDIQRSEINCKLNEIFFINLNDKFNIYSTNKNVLKLLDLMLKPLSQCSAEWIYSAIFNKKNENDIIEILFTQTNCQLSELCAKYFELYQNNLYNDIKLIFAEKDSQFVTMCKTLIECKKRDEESPNNVNKKWANNDAKRLIENVKNNESKMWNILFELCVNRSWSHLNIICSTFETSTRVSLIYELNKLNPHKSASRRAVLTVLNTSHSIHYYFALLFCTAIETKNHKLLQRIVLCRSQIDLSDINYEFTNNKRMNENGKTIKQYIQDLTQSSSSYQYILLNLLGLSDIQIKKHRFKNKENGLIKYAPSIIGQNQNEFAAAKDINLLQTWLKQYSGNKNVLKENLADLLTSRSALQRGEIFSKYPNIVHDIRNKLKKGEVVKLCNGFLSSSIASYNASIIEQCIHQNDINSIGDILCTNNNVQIKQIINEYKNLYYKADLIHKISQLCDKNKRGSVRIILDSLLKCKRNENELKLDENLIENDINFLIATKKFKSDEKKRFVEIFCNNNWKYICEINREYGMRSKNLNLEKLIKSQLGSGSAYFTLILLKYSCHPQEYFVHKLYELGNKFDKNKTQIARIFLTRSEIDLNNIRIRFAKKQAYGKQLDKWIAEKSKGSKFGYFLTQILTSVDRYNQNQKEIIKLKQPDSNNNNNNNKKISKPKKYQDLNFHLEILNSDLKRQESVKMFSSQNNGLIKFLKKHSSSKVVEKMWTKLDSKNKGYIEMNKFPDLIAFIVILYKVKLHQQETKSKGKPEMDNRQIRTEIEHIAVWIAKTYIYDENNQFKLTLNQFQNSFVQWCQQYVDVDGVFVDF